MASQSLLRQGQQLPFQTLLPVAQKTHAVIQRWVSDPKAVGASEDLGLRSPAGRCLRHEEPQPREQPEEEGLEPTAPSQSFRRP